MKLVLNKPWSALLTVPALGFLFFFLLPWASLSFLNSRSLVIAILVVGIVFVPAFLAYLHKITFVKVFGFWVFMIVLNVYNMPEQFDGNQKLAFAGHFMPGILVSLTYSMILIFILLQRKQKKENSK